MPSITLGYTAAGPLLTVIVAPSLPRQQVLKFAGLHVPPHTNGTFLVDTGASNSVVDATLIAPLGLTPTGATMCNTVSTGRNAQLFDQYDVMLIVPRSDTSQAWIIEAIPVMESDFSVQGIQGVIGRDVLDRAMLIYNGPANQFCIAY